MILSTLISSSSRWALQPTMRAVANMGAYAGEVFGTGVLGAMASYPVAAFLLNNRAAALFTFVPSFLVSTAVGAAVSVTVLAALGRTGALGRLEGSLR